MPLGHVPGPGGACTVAAARTLRVVLGGPSPAAGRGWSCAPPARRTIHHPEKASHARGPGLGSTSPSA
eukprot:3072527-Alexandrium_andersonii.AAC.1